MLLSICPDNISTDLIDIPKPELGFQHWHENKPEVDDYLRHLKAILRFHHNNILQSDERFVLAKTYLGQDIPPGDGVLYIRDGINSMCSDRNTMLRVTSMYRFIEHIYLRNTTYNYPNVFYKFLSYTNVKVREI